MSLHLASSDYKLFLEEPGIKVMKFTATWCRPCKAVSPVFEQLSTKYHEVPFVNVDIDEERDIAESYTIMSTPTFIVLKDDKVVERLTGTDMRRLDVAVDTALR